ncbi:MAG: hypothetical protein KAT77_03985 [Nanoarchaeota archaeon]|nr:hypothetical protein [Nanoarchaeota archaeon]
MKCTLCAETITNPICPDCLSQRVFSWLNEINPVLAHKIKTLNLETETGDSCLFCGKKMSICAHCSSRDIYEFLEQNNQDLAKEFAARFDFELRKQLFA